MEHTSFGYELRIRNTGRGGITPQKGRIQMKILGTCGKAERFVVYWFEGDRITIHAANVTFCTNTRDLGEALTICRRNLLNFVAA